MEVEIIPQIVSYLSDTKNYEKRNKDSESWLVNILKDIKSKAVKQGDQEIAKLAWSYETIHAVQKNYLEAFGAMKEGRFFDGWCSLENCEIKIISLQKHFSSPENDPFKLLFLEKHIDQFQTLFPYSVFFSPAFLQLEKECSICGRKISIRSFCEHRKGEIYNGEMCVHVINKAELIEMSVVTNPVQKYSVLFLSDPETGKKVDQYDYKVVKYVINALKHPFDEWEIQKTRIRHPHSLFTHLRKNDDCPCGSGKPYGKCCLRIKDGVLRPHIKIIFHSPINVNTPQIVYPDYQTH